MGEESRRVQNLQLTDKNDAGRGRIQTGRLLNATHQDPSKVRRILKLLAKPFRRQLQQQEQRPPQKKATAQGRPLKEASRALNSLVESLRSDVSFHDCHFYFVLCGMIIVSMS